MGTRGSMGLRCGVILAEQNMRTCPDLATSEVVDGTKPLPVTIGLCAAHLIAWNAVVAHQSIEARRKATE